MVHAMDVLERWKGPKHKVANLFAPLNFTRYPFKSHWTENRLHVYSQKPGNTFLFSYDSILSHPEMDLRKRNIRSLMTDSDTNSSHQVLQVSPAIMASEFQSVEAAYQRRQYDLCLFQILQLLNNHPGNSYLVSRGAKLLIEVYHAKNENRLDELVPRYTREYSDELLEVNNLLFNISKEEAAEMAFHLVNNQGNFDPGCEAHYFLLATICDLTLRSETRQRVEAAYRSRFSDQVENFEYK
jgi:predicted Zn-dependent protease